MTVVCVLVVKPVFTVLLARIEKNVYILFVRLMISSLLSSCIDFFNRTFLIVSIVT